MVHDISCSTYMYSDCIILKKHLKNEQGSKDAAAKKS